MKTIILILMLVGSQNDPRGGVSTSIEQIKGYPNLASCEATKKKLTRGYRSGDAVFTMQGICITKEY